MPAIAAAICGFALLEIILFLFADRPIALFTHELGDTHPDLINFFRDITDLGKSQWYLWPCAIVTIIGGFLSRAKDAPVFYRRLSAYFGVRAFFIFSTVAISGIISDLIKPIAGRARPAEFLNHGLYGFAPFTSAGFLWNSMPSGHSTTVFALAFSLATLYRKQQLFWFAGAIVLAASRVMVDAHYLSDVCAGALLGYLTVRGCLHYGILHLWGVIFPIDKSSHTK